MKFDLDRLRLVIQFTDQSKASYPVELGAYSIGANKACTIRLRSPGIEDVHAILHIHPGSITFNNYSSKPCYMSGVAIPGSTDLAVGDVVALGPYQLSLIELAPPHNIAIGDLSPDAGEQVEELSVQLRRGLPGYDDILVKLAPIISPKEARIARDATHESLRAFGLIALGLSLLLLGTASLPMNRPHLSSLFHDLANAGFLIGSLVLVNRFQVNFAGRVLVPLFWTLKFFEPPISDWYEFTHAPIVFGNLIVAFIVGSALDFGASSDPSRRYRPVRRIALILVGALTIREALVESKNLQGWFLFASVAAGIACIVWNWWPGLEIDRSRTGGSFDAQLVKLIGMRRWFRFASGRFFAVCLGILPALLFLHSFQIKERLRWPKVDSPQSAIKTSGSEPKIWFWEQVGHVLTPDDLKTHVLYGFLDKDVPPVRLEEIRHLTARLDDKPHDRFAYYQLKRALQVYALTSPQKIESILSNFSPASNQGTNRRSIYYLEENKLRPRGHFGIPSEIFSARDQLSFGWKQFRGYTKDEVKSREASSVLRRTLLGLCGLIGLLILWKRGGDWGYAFWLGVWFLGVGTIGAYRYSLFFFSAVSYGIWHRALASLGANLLLNVFQVLNFLVLANIVLLAAFVSCAAVWTWVCWPTIPSLRLSNCRWVPFPGVPYTVVLLGKVALVAFVMNLLFWGTWIGGSALLSLSGWKVDLAPVLASLVFVTCAFGAGYRLKMRTKRGMNHLEWGSGILFLSTQALALVTTPEIPQVSIQSTTLTMLGYTLVCTLIIIFLVLVVRENFLRLFTIRDASIVITASVVMILVKLAEDTMEFAIDSFARATGTPEYGTKALGLLAFVLLVPPVHRRIERLLLHLSLAKFNLKSQPRISLRYLRNIEKRVHATLELLLNTQDPRGISHIRRALAACGIQGYTFASRKGRLTFVSSVTRGNSNPPDQVVISSELIKFLAKRKSAIDLDQLAFDWHLFFYQFELERLRQEMPAKYLIPIRLGESLRGLLLVSSTAYERALSGEQVAEGVSDIALLTTQLRYQHSSHP